MLSQRLPTIFFAKEPALLQDGDHIVDKRRSAILQHVRNDVETINRASAKPCLNRVCDLLGRTHEHAVAKRLNAANDFANRPTLTRQSLNRAMVTDRKRNIICSRQDLLRDWPFEAELLDCHAHASCKSSDGALHIEESVKVFLATNRFFLGTPDTGDKAWQDERGRRAAELPRKRAQALCLLHRR